MSERELQAAHARIIELEEYVAHIQDALTREREVSATWRRKHRQAKNTTHTWRLLYQDLLDKVGRKLDLQGEVR